MLFENMSRFLQPGVRFDEKFGIFIDRDRSEDEILDSELDCDYCMIQHLDRYLSIILRHEGKE